MTSRMQDGKWQFWADQGGTFTDLVGRSPDGRLHTTKVLSASLRGQAGAVEGGVRRLLKAQGGTSDDIASLHIGTTLGTNALLERRAERVVLVTTAGFADLLRIGYQQRPDLFALNIRQQPPLYSRVLEIDERIGADGEVLREPDLERARQAFEQLAGEGERAVAICLLHAWRNPAHERQLKELALGAGMEQVSVSHELMPQIRMVGRGDTTLVDAALSPVIDREFRPLRRALADTQVAVRFMQSSGHLAEADRFRGCDSVLSGPAGGVIGGIEVARHHDLKSVIGFDMGGTSTDVWHFAGQIERRRESEIGGCRILTPTVDVHSIAAGGGSVLRRHLGRLMVGPASAGSVPGPACYGHGGPATVTDANFCTGRLLPAFFPRLFGPNSDQPPDPQASFKALAALGEPVAHIAEDFLAVACDHMARAIATISMKRGYDPSDSTLLCLGGAAGQHACRVAERLDISRILAHPMTGVLSALGVGMARRGTLKRKTLQLDLAGSGADQVLTGQDRQLRSELIAELELQGLAEADLDIRTSVALLYAGTDQPLEMPLATASQLAGQFGKEHQRLYGYQLADRQVLAESLIVEAFERQQPDWLHSGEVAAVSGDGQSADPQADMPRSTRIQSGAREWEAAVLQAGELDETPLTEPALIVHPQFTLAVEPGWSARALGDGSLMLEKIRSAARTGAQPADSGQGQAARLELFMGLFENVAERMGVTLRKTAGSINIRERLDYSCALFNERGELIANAPHIPVHIGSMAESVRALIEAEGAQLQAGDFYAANAPYKGGTHLPDITVITPFFPTSGEEPAQFFLAVRGHHAEIGGIEPGSMPADSTRLEQEGVQFDNLLIERDGQFLTDQVRTVLTAGRWPSRDPDMNLLDLRAQIAACRAGLAEMAAVVERYGEAEVRHWAGQVLDSGEVAVRELTGRLKAGRAESQLENGAELKVRVEPDAGRLLVDFSGTAAATDDNFNAPASVTRAAVLYTLRCLVDEDIPLNDGCMRPVELRIPPGSVLAAEYPSAVVAGNVETSQAVCNLILRALGAQAGSQGTMNNLAFGNEHFQYYETLAGGVGAGPGWAGASAVHSHMTNSRLTDPEILESRLPIRVEHISIRPNSGGPGHWPGGDGMVRQLRFLEPVTCSLITSHRRTGGRGLDGGSDGAPGRNLHLHADGTETPLPACTRVTLNPNDALRIETPGGGGYGQPDESG